MSLALNSVPGNDQLGFRSVSRFSNSSLGGVGMDPSVAAEVIRTPYSGTLQPKPLTVILGCWPCGVKNFHRRVAPDPLMERLRLDCNEANISLTG